MVGQSNFTKKLKQEQIQVSDRLFPYVGAMEVIYSELYHQQPKTYDEVKQLMAGNIYVEDDKSFRFSLYAVNCEVVNNQDAWKIKVINFDDASTTRSTKYFGKELEKTTKIFNDVCAEINNDKTCPKRYLNPQRNVLEEYKKVDQNKSAKQEKGRKER